MELWKRFALDLGRLVAHPQLWHYLLHPLTRYLTAWLLTLSGAGGVLYSAWTCFDDEPTEANKGHVRNDGNVGHCTIDFGGQYLMGRMLLRGHGQHLYHRNYQRQVLQEVYPREDEDPSQEKSDVENLMTWLMGSDDSEAGKTLGAFQAPLAATDSLTLAVLLTAGASEWTPAKMADVTANRLGGALYPPVNAFYYYPLALLKPSVSYHANQVMNLLLAFVAGLGVRVLSQGRIWWPVAVGVILAFPGFNGSIQLGQNATLTLAILVWGWVLIANDRPGWGGAVWGLLAFKPVWAMSFFLVPLLTRRWRVCLTMLSVGAGLAVLTLPWVGLHSWHDWLEVGRNATGIYKTDNNWIHLSRDLLGIPRRWLDFAPEKWQERHDNLPTALIGWSLLGFVLEGTVRLVLYRQDRLHEVTGPGPAFLFFGVWLCCFHFMYYDVLLASLPMFLLLTAPRRFLQPFFVALIPPSTAQLGERHTRYYRPAFSQGPPPPPLLAAGHRNLRVLNSPTLTLFVLVLATASLFPLCGIGLQDFPWDTAFLMALWLWSGCLWIFQPREPALPDAPKEVASDGQERDSAIRAAQFPELRAGVGGAH